MALKVQQELQRYGMNTGGESIGVTIMARCVKCGAETIVFVEGVPVCVVCDDLSSGKRPLILPRPPDKRKDDEDN